MKNKHVFWQALVVSVIIFMIGFALGFFLENYRANSVENRLILSEANLLDEQIRIDAIEKFGVSCSQAKEGLFNFADRIYNEALNLESYGEASQLKGTFFVLHKKYDLLRTLLWMEALDLKKHCGENFHTVVYLYFYDEDNAKLKAKQLFFSRLLREIKDNNPDDILLIPIAVNTELSSLDLIVQKYGIENFPVILIDENIVLDDVISVENLEKIIFESNKQYKQESA